MLNNDREVVKYNKESPVCSKMMTLWFLRLSHFLHDFCVFCPPTELLNFIFRCRVCIIQSRNIFMRCVLADSSQPRNTYLEDQTSLARLLGGFTNQAVDGHWKQEGENGVREKDPRVLPAAEGGRASSANTPGTVHTGKVRAAGIRKLEADAKLHARSHGELFDEEGQGG